MVRAKQNEKTETQWVKPETAERANNLTVVGGKTRYELMADMIGNNYDGKRFVPFEERLDAAYQRWCATLMPEVDRMIASLRISYEKDKRGNCAGARAFAYAARIRDALYKGHKKFGQMGKHEMELMFVGGMILILPESDPARIRFIELWNKRHQRKFHLDERGIPSQLLATK